MFVSAVCLPHSPCGRYVDQEAEDNLPEESACAELIYVIGPDWIPPGTPIPHSAQSLNSLQQSGAEQINTGNMEYLYHLLRTSLVLSITQEEGNLLEAALENAAASIRADKSVEVEPVVDRD